MRKKPLIKTQYKENNAMENNAMENNATVWNTVWNFVARLIVFAFLLAVIIYSLPLHI